MTDRLNYMLRYAGCLCLVAVLVACDPGAPQPEQRDSSFHSEMLPPVPAPVTVSGKLGVAAYQTGVMVFLDRNANRRYDNGEPLSFSDDGGDYRLLTNPGEGNDHPVLAILPAAAYAESRPERSILLESPEGYGDFVSPLTTLVKLEMNKNPTIAADEAQWRVKRRFGIADRVSLFDDYLTKQLKPDERAAEYRRTAQVAEVVGWLLARKTGILEENVQAERPDDYQRLAAFLITDQVNRYAPVVREALNRERNFATDVSLKQIQSDIEVQWNVQLLTRESLDAYAERIRQKPEFWDARPPRIISQTPAPGAIVTIDTVISLVFDKPLDRESLTGTILVTSEAGEVSGAIHYDAEQRRLRFIPDELLAPDSSYQVVVSGQITDTLGNRLMRETRWEFLTAFDRKPPPLPD